MSAKDAPEPQETVWLTHNTGTRVRVAADDVTKYMGLGYQPEESTVTQHPDQTWKVEQLKAYADEHDIDLDVATRKADILDAINGNE